MTDLRYWLLLQSIEGIGPVTYKLLLDKFTEPKFVFESNVKDLESISRLNLKIIERISQSKNRLSEIDNILENLRNRNIRVITMKDENYPQSFKEILNKPPLIYLSKPIPPSKTVGIIGTRDASQHGKEIASQFAQELTKIGYVIVSGYAKGIDTASHFGAMSAQGKTVAVLPTGILRFAIHEELSQHSDNFFDKAIIISEFYPLSEWSVGNALSRNRLTAALSDSILVIESGDSGGTLNTVEYATQMGKKVFLYNGISSLTDEKIKTLGAVSINNIKELVSQLDR